MTKKIILRTLSIFFLVLLFFTAVGAVGAVYLLNKESHNAHTIELKPSPQAISQSFTITDINGEALQESSNIYKYIPAQLSGKEQNIPELYIKALVAVEDSDFYSRKTKGYSIKGVSNAILSEVLTRLHLARGPRGGSTIDQQLAKNIAHGGFNADKSLSRKIVELIDAHSLAERYSRNEILTSYLDTLRLTPDTIGPGAAWNNLFSTPMMTDEKTPLYIAQIAYLAGLGQAPSTYVQDFSGAGKQRALTVLAVMKSSKIISEQEYKDSAEAVKKELKLNPNYTQGIPHAYQAYIAQVQKELGQLALPRNAKVVVKTYATKGHLDYLETVANHTAPDVSNIPRNELPEGALTAISVVDTKTGHILALNTNSDNPQLPISSVRSSGSTIKPLLDYAPALEYGYINENSILNGNATTYANGKPLMNYGGKSYGPVPASFALGNSLNSAALQTFDMTNDDQKNSIMRPLGIASHHYDQSHSISYDFSPLQAASAYSAIGNDGVRVTPTTIASVSVNGQEVPLSQPEAQRAMSSSTARSLVNLMQNVTQPNGSEPLAAQPQWPNAFATKSGLSNFPETATEPARSQGAPDAWMAATSTGVSTAVWVGSPDMSGKYYIPAAPIEQENNMRVYLLNNTIRFMNEGRNVTPFTFSGTALSHTPLLPELPQLVSPPTPQAIQQAKAFNAAAPTVTPKLEEFYQEHRQDKLVEARSVYGANED
ncbi:transglycosylase domain-containing protein [Lactococcus ileimucosae]|uniref:transglycosylase domain-containing protein n=1 Tax=Lactococcus ileimucosae TaxID=2941329 RepID=UPI0035126CB8